MDVQGMYAERIGGRSFGLDTNIYKFEKIKRAKRAIQEENPELELLDFGVGEPDQMAPEPVRAKMKEAVDDPENRGYADNGIMPFCEAAVSYMNRFFGVNDLDPNSEVVHSIGSKSALAMIPLAFVDPGDAVLYTIPGYPVMPTHSRYQNAELCPVPLRPENGFMPDLTEIPEETAKRAKLFYVNYPNNPTGAAASAECLDQLIEFAQTYELLIIQDAAYATLNYSDVPQSILARPGGKDVALELHSMSKSYNMTGWRLGFVAGGAPWVSAFAQVKDTSDSGQFKAIQWAAREGILRPELAEQIRDRYSQRLDGMVDALRQAGFQAEKPGGTFFMYVPAPTGAGATRFADAEEATDFLIRQCGISTVPWDDVGAFLRFSATFVSNGADDDTRVLRELTDRLQKADLRFD